MILGPTSKTTASTFGESGAILLTRSTRRAAAQGPPLILRNVAADWVYGGIPYRQKRCFRETDLRRARLALTACITDATQTGGSGTIDFLLGMPAATDGQAFLRCRKVRGVRPDHADPDLRILRNHTHPGSLNTIGSIHQRRWYFNLARFDSGLEAPVRTGEYKTRRQSDYPEGPLMLRFEPFYVGGSEIERMCGGTRPQIKSAIGGCTRTSYRRHLCSSGGVHRL